MNDRRRIAILVRTVEARFPGTKAVVDPYGSPDDEEIRWWIRILHARRAEEPIVNHFANRLAIDLYDGHVPPFFVGAEGARGTREYLARKRAEATRTKSARTAKRYRSRRRPVSRRLAG